MAAGPPSPLDLVELPFARAALGELLLLAVAGGLLGAFVVLRRLAFFSHAAGTVTFPGLVAAEAASVSPRLAAFAVAGGYAGAVSRTGRREGEADQSAVALLLVGALALGVVLAGELGHSGAGVDRLLFGTLVGLDGTDVATSALASLLAAIGVLGPGRAWSAAGFDPEGARAAGVPVARADLLLLVLVAATVVAALPAVGALLVTTILVVPAAAARLISRSVPTLLALSVGLAALQGVAGLYLALWLDVPPGPVVAVLGACVFAALAVARR